MGSLYIMTPISATGYVLTICNFLWTSTLPYHGVTWTKRWSREGIKFIFSVQLTKLYFFHTERLAHHVHWGWKIRYNIHACFGGIIAVCNLTCLACTFPLNCLHTFALLSLYLFFLQMQRLIRSINTKCRYLMGIHRKMRKISFYHKFNLGITTGNPEHHTPPHNMYTISCEFLYVVIYIHHWFCTSCMQKAPSEPMSCCIIWCRVTSCDVILCISQSRAQTPTTERERVWWQLSISWFLLNQQTWIKVSQSNYMVTDLPTIHLLTNNQYTWSNQTTWLSNQYKPNTVISKKMSCPWQDSNTQHSAY